MRRYKETIITIACAILTLSGVWPGLADDCNNQKAKQNTPDWQEICERPPGGYQREYWKGEFLKADGECGVSSAGNNCELVPSSKEVAVKYYTDWQCTDPHESTGTTTVHYNKPKVTNCGDDDDDDDDDDGE